METSTFTAFEGDRRIAAGKLEAVLLEVKQRHDRGAAPLWVFEDRTGHAIDFDLVGSRAEVLKKLAGHPLLARSAEAPPARSGPGRPRLGVVSREVSLLPRHWRWLEAQRGGMSATLRRLVDEARKRGRGKELARDAREAISRFLWAMAGDRPGFEEATRALFARDDARLATLLRPWPRDIGRWVEERLEEAERLEREAGDG